MRVTILNHAATMIKLVLGFCFITACNQTEETKSRDNFSNSSSNTSSNPSSKTSSILPDDSLLVDLSPESVEGIIPASTDGVTLVNVWATWCAPCIKEFPYLVQLQEKYPEELDIIFISADFPEDKPRAIEFLRNQGVNRTTYLKSGRDLPFIAALSENWSGSIPFTQLILPDGTIFAEWSGEADLERFEEIFLLAREKL